MRRFLCLQVQKYSGICRGTKENQRISEEHCELAKDVRCLFIYRVSIQRQAWSRACVHIHSAHRSRQRAET